MDTVLQGRIAAWIAEHEAEIAQELSEWVRIPSMLDKTTAAAGKPFGQGVADMLKHAAARAESMGLPQLTPTAAGSGYTGRTSAMSSDSISCHAG